jgi:hypothetical protein
MGYLSHVLDVSPLAVLLAAAAILIVGMLWYSPFLFGRAFIRLSGIRPADIRPVDARRNFLVAVITALVSSVLIGLVAAHSGDSAPMLFAGVGFIWLFVMLEQLTHIVWERQPIALFVLQTFRSLASLMAGAAVFYFWS